MGSARLSPVSGVSRDGRPLAHHRPPASDLAPWVARLFVTAVGQPEGQTLSCGLFNDTPFVRVIVRGDWTGHTAEGAVRCSHGPLLFGAHSRRMPITVAGPFATIGFALKPGALAALGDPWGAAGIDCIRPIATDGLWARWARIEDFDARTPEDWLGWLEEALRAYIAASEAPPPDPLATAFDRAILADPSLSLDGFVQARGVSRRQLERVTRRDFGLPPRVVARRARVLDMASQLLGIADANEAAEQALRFYDQSHLIRDFRALLDCTPSQLVRAPQPILTLGLEPRQARRLEVLGRLGQAQRVPWR